MKFTVQQRGEVWIRTSGSNVGQMCSCVLGSDNTSDFAWKCAEALLCVCFVFVGEFRGTVGCA